MNLKLQTQNFKSQKGNINFIRLLFAVTGLLAFCHVVGLFIGEYAWQWERLFRLDGESNIPTWFSSLLLASCAFVSFRCYEAAEKRDLVGYLKLAVNIITGLTPKFKPLKKIIPIITH